MCGIAGFIDGSGAADESKLAATAAAMARAIAHRGPDDRGVWSDREAGVAFGHQRLSIIDLSPAGHQPMVSGNGRYVMVYNGEIYNFRELGRELAERGVAFRGHSDTEVILEACAAWGVEATVKRLIGIFAFALWDRRDRTLTLARDHIGVKPLYWGTQGGLFLFGSELKALLAHDGWRPELERDAVASFMRFGYIPAPHTIYRGVHKLPPGHLLSLRPGAAPSLSCYWDLRRVAASGARNRLEADGKAAADRLESLLRDAVERQMVSDVPLGAFLSGGIDSSTVVALMQAQSSRPVRTFSVGFREEGYNEAHHAKAVARHLGTDHTELYVDPAHALEVIPRIPEWFDEPFADSSQIPTFLVAELTRRHVTVSLSGDGGDELFAGYTHFRRVDALWRYMKAVPRPLRGGVSAAMAGVPDGLWRALFAVAPAGRLPSHPMRKVRTVARLLEMPDADALYRNAISLWREPAEVVPGADEPRNVLWDDSVRRDIPALLDRLQFFDAATYLPDDILVKVDRTSMAVSLEARVPLLDHRVIEFAACLPRQLRLRRGTGKWLLREVLHRYVPRLLVDRPKMGFGVPIDVWLRGPLRDWAESLLDEGTLRHQGVLEPAAVRRAWRTFLADADAPYAPLWNVLMFQAWHKAWRNGTTASRAAAVG